MLTPLLLLLLSSLLLVLDEFVVPLVIGTTAVEEAMLEISIGKFLWLPRMLQPQRRTPRESIR